MVLFMVALSMMLVVDKVLGLFLPGASRPPGQTCPPMRRTEGAG
jgi:hypothetical protein